MSEQAQQVRKVSFVHLIIGTNLPTDRQPGGVAASTVSKTVLGSNLPTRCEQGLAPAKDNWVKIDAGHLLIHYLEL